MGSLSEWQQQGKTFKFNALDIFYRISEKPHAPTLLLIHGFPTSSWDFTKIWEPLSKHFNLITLDMMGFGFSSKPMPHHYSIFEQADIIDTLLKRLKISEFNILAHDYGDTVAQELLARHHATGKIKSCIFTNGGLFPETHKPVFIQKLLLSPLGGLVTKLMTFNKFKKTFDTICEKPLNQEELQGYWQLLQLNNGKAAMRKLIHYMTERKQHRKRWVGVLQDTLVPLHLIDGLLDPISGEHMVKRFEELVPNASVTTIEDTGHYPQVENPQAVLGGAMAFWNTQDILIKT
jgi:pimeloyl-ACP methyl ester carboxylesterase